MTVGVEGLLQLLRRDTRLQSKHNAGWAVQRTLGTIIQAGPPSQATGRQHVRSPPEGRCPSWEMPLQVTRSSKLVPSQFQYLQPSPHKVALSPEQGCTVATYGIS